MTMKQHQKRIDRIAQRLPAASDDEIVIIRLVYGGELQGQPVTLRRGRGGQLIRRIGIDTIPQHLRRD